jgi:hypothetical protein
MSNQVCQGGPEVGKVGSQPCGAPATWDMPYRAVFPHAKFCDLHARGWCDGREPHQDTQRDPWGDYTWRRVAS